LNGFFKWAGSVACLVAVAVTLGGHWLALQSLAWAGMIVDFARHESLVVAVSKTLDGNHPCSLCVTIERGRLDEQQRNKSAAPEVQPGRDPDLSLESRRAPLAPPASTTVPAVPFVARLETQFADSPPTPPPRMVSNASPQARIPSRMPRPAGRLVPLPALVRADLDPRSDSTAAAPLTEQGSRRFLSPASTGSEPLAQSGQSSPARAEAARDIGRG
jgi:hypothetical protein